LTLEYKEKTMSNPFVGEIRLFSFNFPPNGWAFCNGQLLPIAQNSALFDLIGTTYGGDGSTTFGLPDLRGRVPVNQGQGPGLSNYVIGQVAGVESVALSQSQLPAHNHSVFAQKSPAGAGKPGGKLLAETAANTYGSGASTTMNPAMIGATGGGQAVSIVQPYLTLNYCISLTGIFPSQG
jgi:microcystin-dependent protein